MFGYNKLLPSRVWGLFQFDWSMSSFVDSGGACSCATGRFRMFQGFRAGWRYDNVRSGARSTRAALGAWCSAGLRPVNTEHAEIRGHGEWFLRWAYTRFHPCGVHLGGDFLPQNTRKRPSGDTKEALAKPSRLRPRRARPSRKSLNRCCFAKIREGCACRNRGFATNPCRLQAA